MRWLGWIFLIVIAALLWISEYKHELDDIRSEFDSKEKRERNMRNSQPRNYFFCLKKDSGDCTKNFVGDPECEFCQHYLECAKCGHYNTKFCDKCTIAALRQSFDISD